MQQQVVQRHEFHWLAVATLVAAGPQFTGLPLWVSLLLPGAIALRLALGRAPGRLLLIPLVVVVFAGVVFQYRSISGLEAGGAFFTAMVALKFLETRTRRDAGLLACLAYFQATSTFLLTGAIPAAAYVALSITITTAALVTVNAPAPTSSRQVSLQAGRLVLGAVPVMLVLFLLFPRIPGPLWGTGEQGASARSGLSDSMSPGDVSDLAMSPAVAFRVEFDDDVPPGDRLYWRGPVFTDYDGRTWSEREADDGGVPALEAAADRVDYTVTLEPHHRRWLFPLDMPTDAIPDGTRLEAGRQIVSRDRIRSTRRFELESATRYRLEPRLPAERREAALALPSDAAPEARALAADWREQAGDDDRALVERALAWYRSAGFEYTLVPQRLGANPVDEFLFDTRSGFCEHFASSFAVLMRAAGIPARIATGYLGSEQGFAAGYFIVRQSDAHAWVEVWLPGQGWVRVDPTTTVAPDRIRRGLGGIDGASGVTPPASRREDGWLRRAALVWDAVDYTWNRFVVGYGPRMQERLLEQLGLGDLGRYALAVVTIISVGIMLAAIALLAGRRQRRDPVVEAWRRVERRLRRIGLERAPQEGVMDFAERVARERPALAAAVRRLATEYDHLRYRPGQSDRARRTAFARRCRRFRARGGRPAPR